MKHVFLVRHGHSPFGSTTDHMRRLSHLGQTQADSGAAVIQKQMLTVNLPLNSENIICICSDAKRTQQTAFIMTQSLNLKKPISRANLYQASCGDWHNILFEFDHKALILVGHNPVISDLNHQLTDKDHYFSPACISHINIEIQADGLTLPADLIHFHTP